MPALPITRRTAHISRFTLVLYSAAITLITLTPANEAVKVTGIVAWAADIVASTGLFSSADAYTALEFLANIVLFMPFGLLLRLSFPRLPWLLIVAIGFAASLSIELAQLGLPSRFSTVSDVVANTLGTACLSRSLTTQQRSRRSLGPRGASQTGDAS